MTNIKTVHNCTCKDEYKVKGKTFKGCVFGSNTDPKCPVEQRKSALAKECDDDDKTLWCEVKEKNCGYYDDSGSGSRWDHCDYPLEATLDDAESISAPMLLNGVKYIIGTIIFLAVFGILLPMWFAKRGWIELIEVWVTNLDLMATVLSFRGGLFGTGLFSYLYRLTDQGPISYYSQLMVNYFALLGVTLVVAHRVYRTKSIPHGWSVAMVMLMVTYLVPNTIIRSWMEKTFNYFAEHVDDGAKLHGDPHKKATAAAIGVGGALAVFFIYLEKFILEHQIRNLEKFATWVLKPLKLEKIRVEFEKPHKKRR